MDEYISTRPPEDDSGLSGGVSFRFGGQIGTAKLTVSSVGYNYERSSNAGQQTFTVDICVDGVVKKLDIYVAGPPYDPE